MESFSGRPTTGLRSPPHSGEYGPNRHQRVFRHHNVDETPLTIVALGFGALFFAAFIWYFITPLFWTTKVNERDATNVEADMQDTDHISASSAHTLLGYDSATGLNYHNGIGLRGRYPATHGSVSGLPLDNAKSESYRSQPWGPLTTLPPLPFLSYHAESHPTFWRELSPPPPAYSYRPEPTVAPWIGRIPVPRPVHVTPDASAEFAAFFMTGLANPVDDWTFGGSRTTMRRNNWQNRSLSYPGATAEADSLTQALRRNLSDPGRYTANCVISTSIADAQSTLRGGLLAHDGLSPTQPHEAHDTSDNNHSNDTPPPHNALHEPVISSDSMMTIRPCSASYVPYCCAGPVYTATTAPHSQGLAYHHSHYPFGPTSAVFVDGNSRPTLNSAELGSSQTEVFWGTSENECGQSGLRELHHGEIEG